MYQVTQQCAKSAVHNCVTPSSLSNEPSASASRVDGLTGGRINRHMSAEFKVNFDALA